jgi:hypothetical protein
MSCVRGAIWASGGSRRRSGALNMRRMRQLARGHERVFVATFLGVVIVVCAVIDGSSWPNAGPAARIAVVALWVLCGSAVAGWQWRVARRGQLTLRDPAAREANARRIARWQGSARWAFPAMVVIVLVLGILTHQAKALVAAAIGGTTLGFAPVLLWIAFRLRPDQHRGERLDG